MRIDFAQIQALQASARRERSEAIYRILVAPVIALLKPRQIVPAPRPHLARQG